MKNVLLSSAIAKTLMVAVLCVNVSLSGASSTGTDAQVTREGPIAPHAACQGGGRSRATNASAIVGLYRQSTSDLPAYVWNSNEKRIGNNYLAITVAGSGDLRVRVATKEVNGHDCALDSRAVLCGNEIWIIPSMDDEKELVASGQTAPKLEVTREEIRFLRNADGTVVSGAPYCGNRGALDESFKRRTRRAKIDDSVFTQ